MKREILLGVNEVMRPRRHASGDVGIRTFQDQTYIGELASVVHTLPAALPPTQSCRASRISRGRPALCCSSFPLAIRIVRTFSNCPKRKRLSKYQTASSGACRAE